MALRHLFLMLYWWEWLAYAFAFFTATWFAIWIVKSEFTTSTLNSGTITESDTVPTAPLRHHTATLASRWLAACLFAVSVWASGYGYRDHQLIASTITYRNVLVTKKLADRDFKILPQWMDEKHIQICPDSTVDWHEGEMLDYWTFEQQQGCKRVISYKETPQGEQDASIQMR